MSDLMFVKPLVARILEEGAKREWSVQGFGMMRTYFGPPDNPKEFRLNIWDDRLAVPNVSTIHDHPWHFDSLVISKLFTNRRFNMVPANATGYALSHTYTTIRTGEGGGPVKDEPQHCLLQPFADEVYGPGNTYHQDADEIHETIYHRGCVTLNKRRRVGDGEHARVFWPYGTPWVDAEPRLAHPLEMKRILDTALEGFND